MPPVLSSTGWVVGCFDGEHPRFLCRDARHGHWVVATDPARALKFADVQHASRALADYEGRGHERHRLAPGGSWAVFETAQRTSFRPTDLHAPG